MGSDAMRYLTLISEHLKEHHASLLVGSGFSHNAKKIDKNVPDSPMWDDLANAFIKKITNDPEEQEELKKVSPLVLAERVEVMFGRPELDHLLLSSIRDCDYLPSQLHKKLLSLPWSDVFTTNYDTLLERSSNELTEKSFSIITEKEDLMGSSGSTRIIKLHGSFPSHRPFIITSEDYRTYPQKFAPFVNTVQQSLLENTLCLIGFSGNDPNFELWTGWIRDNLGENNAPNIYLLLHRTPSEAEKKLWLRRKIIPVDLTQIAEDKLPCLLYETAIDVLCKSQRSMKPDKWDLDQKLVDKQGKIVSIESAIQILKEIRESYPGWITMPHGKIQYIRSCILGDAERILSVLKNQREESNGCYIKAISQYRELYHSLTHFSFPGW